MSGATGPRRRPGPLAPRSASPFLVAAVSAAMCFLAVCALEAAAAAARVSGAWTTGLSGAATIRVPAPTGWEDAQARAAAALAVAASTEGVAQARMLDRAELEALVGPWLGEAAAQLTVGAPPTPILIDVALENPPADGGALQALLDVASPGAVYDDHAAWREPLAEAAAAFTRLAYWSVGLMGVALAAMVSVSARASMAGAAAAVRTLRLVGAQDGMIARAFDRPVALRALLGGAAGAAAAAAALSAAPALGVAEGLGAPPEAFRAQVWPLIGAPLVSAAVGYAAARLTVLSLLRRET